MGFHYAAGAQDGDPPFNAQHRVKGLLGDRFPAWSGRPWGECKDRKWLCPVPGYDRHFDITEFFGFEMINIEMDENGPDIAKIEELVCADPSIKGIWCVPQYSNPGGVTYSDEVVRRLAALKPAAPDFRIFWDNAYCVHHLYPDHQDHLKNIYTACVAAGHPDRPILFTSTSKITFAGAGVGAMAASPANVARQLELLSHQMVCYDKLNSKKDTANLSAASFPAFSLYFFMFPFCIFVL